MEKSADEIVEEEHRPSSITINPETASSIAEHAADRLNKLIGNRPRQRDALLRENCGEHEEDAVRRPKESGGHNPYQDCPPGAPLFKQFQHGDAGFDCDFGVDLWYGLELISCAFATERLPLDFGDRLLGFGNAALAKQVTHRFRHIAAHEEQEHRRDDTNRKQRAPAKGRKNA